MKLSGQKARNTKQDRARVAKKQVWEIAWIAKKFKVSQKMVREAMENAVTKKGKHSIARVNVEYALKKMIEMGIV